MKEITPEMLRARLRNGEPIHLLDVREAHEREAFHIGGDWIPLNEVIRSHERIPKDIPVVVYCRKGIRSGIAIQRLEERFGFGNLYNLKGGVGEHAGELLL